MCALRNEKMDRFALEPQILEFHSGEPAPVRRRRSGERLRKEGLAREVMESPVFKCRYVSHECIHGKNLAFVSPIQRNRNAKGVSLWRRPARGVAAVVPLACYAAGGLSSSRTRPQYRAA